MAILILAAVYFGTAWFGLSLASINASASPVWPPSGIALIALLLFGHRLWPGIFIGAFAANILTQGTVLTSLGIATGNSLEALAGAWLINRFAGGRHAFEHASHIFSFLFFAMVSTAISATVGVVSLVLGGFVAWPHYLPVWTTWWLGDLTGVTVVVPLLLIWQSAPAMRWNRRRAMEILAILGVVLLIGVLSFNDPLHPMLGRYMRFLLYPAALWAAYRFGQFGAINAVLVIAVVATWGTCHGTGPFVIPDGNQSLLLLQAYLGTFTITNLVLGALVSERARTETVLRESNDRFHTLASHAPVGIFMAKASGDWIYANESWCSMAGLSPAQSFENGWARRIHPDDRDRVLAAWSGAVRHKDASTAEFRLQQADGGALWVYWHAVQLWNTAGEVTGYIGTVTDITARKLAEADLELRVQERTMEWALANATLKGEIVKHQAAALARDRLAALVENSHDAILSKTLNGIITSWNRGAQRMFGYTAKEIIGQPITTLIPNDRHDELGEVLDRIQRDEVVEPFETIRRRKDGRLVYVSMSLSPVKDELNQILGASAIMRDITEQKRLEEEILQVSEREQRRIAEDLHDGVGQQLGGICCLSDVLKRNLEDQASPETGAAAKISALLGVAMAQTRNIARGLHPVPPESDGLMHALEELAERITDIFKVNCRFLCPQTVLIEDEATATHLYRIAQEAITNSIKHGQANQIDVSLTTGPEGPRLTVSDNGAGFELNHHSRQGLGLRIMNHRAGMINALLVVQNLGPGTRVACTIHRRNGSGHG
ncbi:MAG: PAS domain S-box protein [Verrucomicrobiota bacterium]